MQMIKCEMGHIYDAEKFRTCPHCYSTGMTREAEDDMMGINQADKETEQPDEAQKRQYYVMHRRRVTGMLVCVDGNMKGEGFVIREGDNLVGRSSNMDVALTMEESVSRQQHVILCCDVEDGSCILRYDKNRQDIWVNGSRPRRDCLLKDHDEICLGKCKLIFIEAGDIWKDRK